jgi:competence protein ComEC
MIMVGLVTHKPLVHAAEHLRVHFIDVGYGDAILIQLPQQQNVLIDAGSTESQDKLVSYLQGLQIKTINKLVLTHPHKDHFGGIPALLEHFSVERFYSNGEKERYHEGFLDVRQNVREQGFEPRRLQKGDQFVLGDPPVTFRFLNPDRLEGPANADALVTLVAYGDRAFLLTSDIDRKRQAILMDSLSPEIISRIDVVQISHHGDRVDPVFRKEMRGKIFVVSTGENDYDLPDEEGLSQLEGNVLRTDVAQSIVFETDGQDVRYVQE